MEDSSRGTNYSHDRNKVKCYNYNIYRHDASECRKPRREHEKKFDVNFTQVHDDEPAFLVSECAEKESNLILLKKKGWSQGRS